MLLHQFGAATSKNEAPMVSPHLPAFDPSTTLSPYMPVFPNVPAKVAETPMLMTKEVFIQNFKALASIYLLLASPQTEERDAKLFAELKELQNKIEQINLFTVMAIFGTFALYHHPAKNNGTECTLTAALNDNHPLHTHLREWIWGLHWSLLHTMGGPDPVVNKTKYTRRLTDHLFTALNQIDWVLDAKNNEVPPQDHKFRPLFDQCVEIAKAITDQAYDLVIKSYLNFDASKKVKLEL